MDVFKALKLTSGEEKVYKALIKLGSSTTGSIYKEANVSQSKVYQILDRLKKKGLVATITKNGSSYWHSAKPSIYLDKINDELIEIQERKKILEKELPNIIEEREKGKDDAQLLIGYNGFRTTLYSLLDSLKKGDELLIIGSPVPVAEPFYSFVHAFNLKRAENKIPAKFLYSEEMREFAKKMITETYTKVKFVNFKTPSTILIGKDRIIIITWEGPGKCVVIMGIEIARNYSDFFESLWKISKS